MTRRSCPTWPHCRRCPETLSSEDERTFAWRTALRVWLLASAVLLYCTCGGENGFSFPCFICGITRKILLCGFTFSLPERKIVWVRTLNSVDNCEQKNEGKTERRERIEGGGENFKAKKNKRFLSRRREASRNGGRLLSNHTSQHPRGQSSSNKNCSQGVSSTWPLTYEIGPNETWWDRHVARTQFIFENAKERNDMDQH